MMELPTPIRAGMQRLYCSTCRVPKCRHGNVIICHGCGSHKVLKPQGGVL